LYCKKEASLKIGNQVWYCQSTKAKATLWSVDLRGIKLLEHAMKVVERIFEHRIRQQIVIDDMQFGFMKSNGTTDTIFYFKTDAGEF